MTLVSRATVVLSTCAGLFLLESKNFQLELKQDSEDGEVTARFATLNVVDKDGDVTVPGAFGKQNVRLASWGHNWARLPVGSGSIRESRETAIFDGKFFTDTTGGLDTFRTVKHLGELQEWSYGFDVDEYSLRKPEDGETSRRYDGMIRVLQKLTVHEVSPVMIGAGVDTRTLRLKGLQVTGALVLLRKVREGGELSEAEIEQLAELIGAPAADIGKALTVSKDPDPAPDPAPASDPTPADPDPQAPKQGDKTDPDPEPVELDPSKLFMEFQHIQAMAPPRS